MNAYDYFFEKSKHLNKNFLLGSKEQISYHDLYNQSLAFAQIINKKTDDKEKILLISPNNIFFLIAYLGIMKSGRTCVPLNPEIEPGTLSYIKKECNARFALVPENLSKRYDLTDVEVISDLSTNLLKPAATLSDPTFDSERCAEIIFTSGSTGVPKGVMISHKNLMANTSSIVKYLRLTENDIMEVVLPFYYCYGLSLLHTHLRVGGSIVLNNTFIFLGSVLKDLKVYKCTGFAGVPSHFQILLRKSESFKKTTFPDLRYVTQAGGKLHNVFIREFIEAHPEINFYVMYGQTEATARLSYLPLDKLNDKLGSIGKGIPDVELRVVNEKNDDIKPGDIGEIIAKGNNIMLGYLNDPETTTQTIRNNWLHTGDLGTVDQDGFIFLKARSKEIIKAGGKRISPKEIEEVIVSVPDVIDCTVFGVQDEVMGEAIKAKIVIDKAKSEEITADTIKEFCARQLSGYKVPHQIEIEHKVNISSTGKKIKSKIN